ncbi:MAG: hypothetical protein A2V66_01605 [Ignavibacteria bacterium RBG_13_36_8]|nr:MAG: hypothetical protein A2V66_01605 [Ignavibacteria bacterium RBG_13_36_8]
MTKSDITKNLKVLEKYGYHLTIFQTDRKKRKQEKGFPDYHLAGREGVIYLECKIRDKLSEDQRELLKKLWKIMNCSSHVYAGIITENNCKEIVNSILEGLTHKLRTILIRSLEKY